MKDFKNKVIEHLSNYKENVLKIDEKGLYRKNEYRHILPLSYKHSNFLAGVDLPAGLHLHMYAHHLNSSQVMCINFFAPLLNNEMGQKLLLDILHNSNVLKIESNTEIRKALFEMVEDANENTNFDFYIELSSGERIFFEIKYTEDGFGKTHPDKNSPLKYKNKWDKIYSEHIKKSLLLKDMDEDTFYANYQIWRNVSYIRDTSDYVFFLFPFENKKACSDINKTINCDDKFSCNVKSIDWKNIAETALNLSVGTEYHNHFKEFYTKYLAF